jgi:hypothetical protein
MRVLLGMLRLDFASGGRAGQAMTAALALALVGLELGLRPGERNGLRPAATDDLAATDLRLAGIIRGRNCRCGTALLPDQFRLEHIAAFDAVADEAATAVGKTFDLYDLQVCSPMLTICFFFLRWYDWVIPAFGPWLAA